MSSGVDGQRVEGKGDGEDHLKGAQKRLPHSVVVLEVPITAVVAVVVVTMSMGGKGASRGGGAVRMRVNIEDEGIGARG